MLGCKRAEHGQVIRDGSGEGGDSRFKRQHQRAVSFPRDPQDAMDCALESRKSDVRVESELSPSRVDYASGFTNWLMVSSTGYTRSMPQTRHTLLAD